MNNNTLHLIKKYIAEQKLFQPDDTLLVAVSGGMDSMVLLYALKELGYKLQVAHVNFQLRGEDSNADELLVKTTCEKLGIPVLIKKVDMKLATANYEGSTQMMARTIRYDWFKELLAEHAINNLVVAHHANDQSETILQHLTKGSGIAGLRGMLPKNKQVCRPFLCIDKKTIEYLAQELKVPYREDASNASDKYERNKIRHQNIPTLENINPKLHQSIYNTTNYLRGVENIYQSYIQKRLKQLVKRDAADAYLAPAKSFANDKFGINLLFEWLSVYGFNSEQMEDIYFQVKNNASGKDYFAGEHRLVVDRKFLFLQSANSSIKTNIQIDSLPYEIEINKKKITIDYVNNAPTTFDKNNLEIVLDAADIELPLTIRNWQEGDYMYPLGMMMKKKKLSDIFINKKIAKHKKSSLLLFFSNQKLFFVEGITIDERFKIKNSTNKLLKISIK